MKKVIPFTKTVTFKTMLAEITEIEIKHTLEVNGEKEVEGDILIDGKYKMTEASSIEEEFHYKFPFMIAIDSKYNIDDLNISISDFHYEIINEEDLKIDVEIELDGIINEEERLSNEILEEKTEIESIDPFEELEKEIQEEKKKDAIEIEEKIEEKEVEPIKIETEDNNNIESIFSSITKTEEQYSTYYVYVVNENDTIEKILEKYKITKEELQNYNDLSTIKAGTKLIIPCSNE